MAIIGFTKLDSHFSPITGRTVRNLFICFQQQTLFHFNSILTVNENFKALGDPGKYSLISYLF